MRPDVSAPDEPPRDGWRPALPGARREAAFTLLGLYLGVFLYYSRRVPWFSLGVMVVTATALYLALSLRYANPTPLAALHLTRRRAGLYLLVGLLLILPGWFFDSLYSHLSGRGWLPFGVATSLPLVLSIIAVATSEEVFFRGYLLGRLKSFGCRRWARTLLVCTLFALYKVIVHAWDGWPPGVYLEFFLFAALKMVFETWWVDWTGSIVTPLVIHLGWDLIVFHAYTGPPPWFL